MKCNLVILLIPSLFLFNQANSYAANEPGLFAGFKTIVIDTIPITIHGWVKGKESGESIIGASVAVKGTGDGTATDGSGEFTLSTLHGFPVPLIVTYSQYDTLFLQVHSADDLIIYLAYSKLMEEAIVVSERDQGLERDSPNDVARLDARGIREGAASSAIENIATQAGIDLIRPSLAMPMINTRGFNSTSPVRMLQIIDGVDNQSPGLNFSLGNFLGTSDLDIERMEVVLGASGPFYGPNAFNGVIKMETKNPFYHPGTEIQMRAGERNLFEGAIRHAGIITSKDSLPIAAWKLNLSALTAYDWEATNYSAIQGSKVGETNPGGYDAVNIYGDDYSPRSDKTLDDGRYYFFGGLETYYRKGYKETELVDYDTRNYKGSLAFHLRTNPTKKDSSPELILNSSFGSGNAIYQGDNRFALRNILFFQHRLEWRSIDRFFIRGYFTHEDAGQTYDPYFTALRLQEINKPYNAWSAAYSQYWRDNILPQMEAMGYPVVCPGCPEFFDTPAAIAWIAANQDKLTLWHAETQEAAGLASENIPSVDRLNPGSEAFDHAFRDITSRLNHEAGGTRFYDKSALFHLHGERIFKKETGFFDEVRIGGSFRMYMPDSKGTIFYDTADVKIRNKEFGLYAGVKKQFLEAKNLTSSFTVRVDKNENFKLIPTFAGGLEWKLAANTWWSVFASSAIRNPTLTDQFLYLNVGPAILAGQTTGVDSLITPESFRMSLEKLDKNLLRYFTIAPIQPEYVTSFESIIKTKIGPRLSIEAGYYRSQYKNFIGYLIGIEARYNPLSMLPFPEYVQVYRYSANSDSKVITQGFGFSFQYGTDDVSLRGNYSYNKLQKTNAADPIIPAYNTPLHKFNLGFSARNIKWLPSGFLRQLGFSVNYKLVDGYVFEGSPQFTGKLPAYGVVDAQINLQSKNDKTMIKVGASNLLNHRHFETYGGPSIGRLAYVQVNYRF